MRIVYKFKKLKILIFFTLLSNLILAESVNDIDIISITRKSCVEILINGSRVGTGFFITNDIVVSCLHVVAKISNDSAQTQISFYSDLKAVTIAGDTVSLKGISMPTDTFPEPYFYDFAILKTDKTLSDISILPLDLGLKVNGIFDSIVFSGYPLGAPAMLTNYGSISGFTKDSTLICIQAPINKGNSGGALINKAGNVIGIISMREGALSKELQNYLLQIDQRQGFISFGSNNQISIDPLSVSRETISVLDRYISTGIGYAINIRYLNNYINKVYSTK